MNKLEIKILSKTNTSINIKNRKINNLIGDVVLIFKIKKSFLDDKKPPIMNKSNCEKGNI